MLDAIDALAALFAFVMAVTNAVIAAASGHLGFAAVGVVFVAVGVFLVVR